MHSFLQFRVRAGSEKVCIVVPLCEDVADSLSGLSVLLVLLVEQASQPRIEQGV